MAYRCPSCNKLCSTEPEVVNTSYDVDTESGDVTITVEASLTSTCCSDTAASGEIELTINLRNEHDCRDDETANEGEFSDEIDENDAEIEERQIEYLGLGAKKKDGSYGKPQKRTRKGYIVVVESKVKCLTCQQDVSFKLEDEIEFEAY